MSIDTAPVNGVHWSSTAGGEGGTSVDGLVGLFEDWERRRNLSQRTITDRRRRLASLAAFASAAGLALFDVEAAHIEAWLDSTTPPLTPPSRYTYITAVNAFYSWAVTEGFLLVNPCAKVVRPRLPVRNPRPVSLEVVRVMLGQAVCPKVRVWTALGAFAGLRVSEMAALQAAEVDRDRGKITVAGKGGRVRVVPMHAEVRRALGMLPLPRAGLVTPKDDGGRYAPTTVGAYLKRHMLVCGVDGTPHQLRHFFITEVHERSGGDLLVAREAAGHANVQTTAGYAAYSHGRLDAAVLAVGSGVPCCPVCGR